MLSTNSTVSSHVLSLNDAGSGNEKTEIHPQSLIFICAWLFFSFRWAMDVSSLEQHNSGLPNKSQKKNKYWKDMFKSNTKKSGKRNQEPYGMKKVHKIQDFRRLQQAKLRNLLCKRNRRQKEREIQRRTCTVEQQIHLSTCQALNRFQNRCKTKVLENSNFCKIHQFYDSNSELVQCLGTNKRFKRCIKSVPKDEQYCYYHKNKEKIVK